LPAGPLFLGTQKIVSDEQQNLQLCT